MSKKTIYDLSKELNLAPSTISKALNDVPGVNEETRARIIEYAKANSYFANPTARALKSKKSYTIGVLYSEASNVGLEHPFFSMVLQSAKTFLEEKGYDLIFINSKANDYQGYTSFCTLRNIAGVFIVSASDDDVLLKELLESNSLCVVATDYINDDVTTVLTDNRQGVSDLVTYLRNKKVRNVGLVSPSNGVRSFKEREQTFIDKCHENKITLLPQNIIHTKTYSTEEAYDAVDQFLENNNPPEVIFALSDIFALSTIRALSKHGYKVPKDCSVFGFDDIVFASYCFPTLSTIRQDAKKIGEVAATLLLKKMNAIEVKEKMHYVPASLIIRESSK